MNEKKYSEIVKIGVETTKKKIGILLDALVKLCNEPPEQRYALDLSLKIIIEPNKPL